MTSEFEQHRTHHARRKLINDQPCSFCKARPGKPCTVSGGSQPMSRPHVARVIAAREAQEARTLANA